MDATVFHLSSTEGLHCIAVTNLLGMHFPRSHGTSNYLDPLGIQFRRWRNLMSLNQINYYSLVLAHNCMFHWWSNSSYCRRHIPSDSSLSLIFSVGGGILQGPPCIANRCDSGGENDPNCGNLLIGSLAPIRVSSASASLQMSRSLREDWSLDDDVDPRKIGNGAGAAGWACDQDGKWIKTDSECKHTDRSKPIPFLESYSPTNSTKYTKSNVAQLLYCCWDS